MNLPEKCFRGLIPRTWHASRNTCKDISPSLRRPAISDALRRTTATFMAQVGEMDEVIDAVLNHAKHGVIKVYNQYRYDKEKQSNLKNGA